MALVSTSSRLSFGLVMLTVFILLGADLLGIIPDKKNTIIAEREKIGESFCLLSSRAADKNDIDTIIYMINTMVEKNEDILSASLAHVNGTVLLTTQNHENYWQEAEPDKSTPTHIRVPVYGDGKIVYNAEFSFVPVSGKGIRGIIFNPVVKLVLFVFLTGFILYMFFLKKTLKHLDPSAVIPPRVRTALDTLSEGVVLMDNSACVVLANEAFSEKAGISLPDLMGQRISDMNWVVPASVSPGLIHPWITTLRKKQKLTGVSLHLDDLSGNRRTFLVNSSPILDGNRNSRGVLTTFDDITQIEEKNEQLKNLVEELELSSEKIKEQNRELEYFATTDPLTGCRNRRSFFEIFDKHYSSSERYKHQLSCVMFDIDHFKSINDNHGHSAGDDVLRSFAEIIKSLLRKTDIVGRYGGEEFCVILPHTEITKAAEVAERYRRSIEAHDFSGIPVTASFGVSSTAGGAKNPSSLIDQADQALYVAKESGRNCVISYTQLPGTSNTGTPITEKKVGNTKKNEKSEKEKSGEISDNNKDDTRKEALRIVKETIDSKDKNSGFLSSRVTASNNNDSSIQLNKNDQWVDEDTSDNKKDDKQSISQAAKILKDLSEYK